MAAGARGARVYGFVGRFVDDVITVGWFSGLWIELRPDVLEDGFFVAEILSRLPIELPQDSIFSDGEQPVLAARINKNALEDDIQIQRFAGRMLVVPLELAVVGVDGNRRARIKRVAFGSPRESHPGFGLGSSPECEIENGIITARNPHLRARTIAIRKIAPCVRSRIAGGRDGIKAPQLFAGCRVVGAHETFLFLVALACAKTFEHFAIDDERPARVAVARGNLRVPGFLPVARIERDHTIAAGEIDFVLINRDPAHRNVAAETVFPDDPAGHAVDRLDDAARVGEIDHSVVHDGCGLIRAAFMHRRFPDQLKILHVVACDLIQRTVVGGRIIATDHQPVAGIGVLQHRVGHRNIVLNLTRDGHTRRFGAANHWATTLPASTLLLSGNDQRAQDQKSK